MKALSVQQPFAFEILSGQKSIEVRSWETDHRGDLLICSSGKPAFSRMEMEELEDEYGCTFLYGHALCLVCIADVRHRKPGDENRALLDEIDPEDYCWVIGDVRPVIPFPVRGKQGIFEVDDALIAVSPFKYDDTVVVKPGTLSQDLVIDFSGWHGRTVDIQLSEKGDPLIHVVWDSPSLRGMPPSVMEKMVKEGFDWTGGLLRLNEIEHAEPRDTWDDVREAIENTEETYSAFFSDQ